MLYTNWPAIGLSPSLTPPHPPWHPFKMFQMPGRGAERTGNHVTAVIRCHSGHLIKRQSRWLPIINPDREVHDLLGPRSDHALRTESSHPAAYMCILRALKPHFCLPRTCVTRAATGLR